MKKFALIGNPNSGKTTLFNALTGSTAYVGNWPGVTVDKKEGTYKKGKEPVDIVDLPGIYSLSPYTSEEIISRNFILDEKPDCVINIVDASNLERNLYLTTQLMEINVPIIIALNMMDAVRKNGDVIDTQKLEQIIGLPVVEISALHKENIDILMERAIETAYTKRNASTILENSSLGELIESCRIVLFKEGKDNPLFHSIKLIELDEAEEKPSEKIDELLNQFKKDYKNDVFDNDFAGIIADERYKYITSNYMCARTRKETGKEFLSTSDKIDKVLTNKWASIPIFLLILFLIFHLTFSENLFWFGGLIHSNSFENSEFFSGAIFHEGGINSPGVMLQSLLTGTTDWLSSLVSSWLESSPEWVSAFLVDGVLSGLFAVVSFIPQILVLFLFFAILEDSGYMARIAFILDRILRRFGLSGRAFMPMIMGFGCSVPAMINTRTLADDNERTATIRVIPFFSCGAKLPILTAIAGGLVQYFGMGNADVITYSMYVLGMTTALVAVILMRSTTMKGEVPPFIMELPSYHLPQFKSLMIHLWDKLKHFIKKAFTIILASTIVIWFLSSFSWAFWNGMVDDIADSILGSFGKVLQPLFTPLGFGAQLAATGWVFTVAAITGLIAKENVIATFGTLAASLIAGFEINESLEGVDSVVAIIHSTGATIPALIAFIAFNMLTIPCFAAVATAKAELPKNKFWTTILFWIMTSYTVGSMIYTIGTWWWTVFIWLAVVAVIVTLIIYFNKYKKDNKKICNQLK